MRLRSRLFGSIGRTDRANAGPSQIRLRADAPTRSGAFHRYGSAGEPGSFGLLPSSGQRRTCRECCHGPQDEGCDDGAVASLAPARSQHAASRLQGRGICGRAVGAVLLDDGNRSVAGRAAFWPPWSSIDRLSVGQTCVMAQRINSTEAPVRSIGRGLFFLPRATLRRRVAHRTNSRAWRISSAIDRRRAISLSTVAPCFQAFLFPFGAPGDVPPCIRHRPFFIAGDWHSVPRRVRGSECRGYRRYHVWTFVTLPLSM